MANEDSDISYENKWGIVPPWNATNMRFDPLGAIRRLTGESAAPVPTYDGSSHGIDQSGRIVPMPPEQPDTTPGAEPTPIFSKKDMKAIEPFHNRILALAEGFGTTHMIAPDSQEMHDALGTSAKAQGISNPWLYNVPVLGNIARSIGSKAQSVMNTQEAASKAYAMALNAKMQETLSGPNTVGEAQQLGIPVPYTPQQLANQIEAPRGSLGLEQGGLSSIEHGPQPGIVNPNQDLTLPQQIGVTGPIMKGIAGGQIAVTPHGILPSYTAGMSGIPRTVPSEVIQQAVNGILPPGEDGAPQIVVPSGNHPIAFADTVLNNVHALAQRSNPNFMDMGNDREAIATDLSKEKTGKVLRYTQLVQQHPELMPEFDKRYAKLLEQQGQSRSQGTMNTTLGAPLKAAERADTFDRKEFMKSGTLVPLAPDLTGGGVSDAHARANGLNVSDKDRDQLYAVDQAGANLDAIIEQGRRLITAKTPEEGLIQGGKIYAAGNAATRMLLARTNPEFDAAGASTFTDTLKALSNNLAKAFGGERGVLTNVDVQRWVSAMPRGTDTAEIRQRKEVILGKLYAEAKRAQLRAIAGDVSVTDLRKQVQKNTSSLMSQLDKINQTGKAVTPEQRYNELKKSGMGDADIYKQLATEGH